MAGNWITAVFNLFRRDRPQIAWRWQDRYYAYLLFDSYYHNTVYQETINGGQREQINALLGNAAAADLAGIYNPVARVVDLYQHVFGGEFGVDILLDPKQSPRPMIAPLTQLWQWSNMNYQKQVLCRLAATHGNVGLRIIVKNDPDPAKRRITIKPEHPRVIRDVDLDERGNVRAIELEYELSSGVGQNKINYVIRELQTKTEFSTSRVEESGNLIPFDPGTFEDYGPNSTYPNELGVVPYVLLAHTPLGETWGVNAFYRSLSALDRLNALVTHINVQIHRHVKAKWVIAASGAAPTEIDLSDLSVAYIDTRGATTLPTIQPLVANLNLADAIVEAKMIIEGLEDDLPELKATAGKFLAGQSGETVMQLRKPAIDKLALARVNYEDALIRAQQIAISWGVLIDVWDVGTGHGTVAAAEAAYHQGLEDHRFNSRDLLPFSPQEQIALNISRVELATKQADLDTLVVREKARMIAALASGYTAGFIEDSQKDAIYREVGLPPRLPGTLPPVNGTEAQIAALPVGEAQVSV